MSATPNPDPKPSGPAAPSASRITVVDIAKMHADGQRIPMLTAYDYPTAHLLAEAGIPMLLVGDSVGQAMLGYEIDGPGHDGRDDPPHEGGRPRRRPGPRRR